MIKNDSPNKLTLALARLNDFNISKPKVDRLIARAKVLAKDIRATRRDNWRPSVDRLCRCGHPFSKHGAANCEHEVGGDCMRHICARSCGHHYQGKYVGRRWVIKNCRCKEFRERP